jgi:hypothetical protein
MLLSAVCLSLVALPSSEISEGLMNYPVFSTFTPESCRLILNSWLHIDDSGIISVKYRESDTAQEE